MHLNITKIVVKTIWRTYDLSFCPKRLLSSISFFNDSQDVRRSAKVRYQTCKNARKTTCFVRYKSARSCHLSVLRMNQTDELATKRVFGVITLWTTDYLFSCRFNSFLSSYRFILYYCCSFTGVDTVFLQVTSL